MRVRLELEIDTGTREPATLIDELVFRPPPSRTERCVRGAWRGFCAIGAVLRAVVGEVLCLFLAGLGLLGQPLDRAGRAARRNSWIITEGSKALAQLPPPRPVERLPETTTAITVRADR